MVPIEPAGEISWGADKPPCCYGMGITGNQHDEDCIVGIREGKIRHIKEHPEQHRHTFDALQACCYLKGAIDLATMEAHSSVNLGTNGGVRCDVVEGPCACGAWH
jgi:hypothetical protein